VEQLHKVFKLCGSPTEEYWKKSRFPNATLYKPQQPYKCCISETFKDFPPSAVSLIQTLLTIDPDARGTAATALNDHFFTSEPRACEPSSLPKSPPSKEIDIKLREEEKRKQQRAVHPKPPIVDRHRRGRAREGLISRAIPAPEANAELQTNLDRLRFVSEARARSKSEKFPPPHKDAAVGHTVLEGAADSSSFSSSVFDLPKSSRSMAASSKNAGGGNRKQQQQQQQQGGNKFVSAFYSSA
ncbi:hypothetical protein M569_00154, partial [Genlisea aurea]